MNSALIPLALVRQLTVSILLPCLAASTLLAGGYPSSGATQRFTAPDGSTVLADGSTMGSDGTAVAQIRLNALQLAQAGVTNAIGAFKLPDLDPGNVARSFDVAFTVATKAPATGPVGQGWSVNFGRLPEDNGTGEGGFAPLRGGLTVAFQIANSEGSSSALEVLVGGVSVARFPRAFRLDGLPRAVSLHWDLLGLDLSFDGSVIFTDLNVPGFSPGVGDTFGFSARTTDASMDLIFDDLRVTTQSLPVLNTGGPIISEFVASNGDFEDEFAEKPGWIELFNGGPQTANLDGWFLTDSKKNATKWRISSLVLPPYNYVVVFASGRDRQLSTNSFLHANFTLAKTSGYVALVRPDSSIASSYEYASQDKGVSYGEQGANRARGYMYPPSPGTVNVVAPSPFSRSADVQFSHSGGFVDQPVNLALSIPASPGAEIRYTLDRTEPGPNSALYANPLTITQTTMVRARSYSPDHLPGRVASRTVVMMEGSLTNYANTGKVFDSNLPLVYLDSFGVSVDGSTGGSRPYRPSYALIIPPDPLTGRTSLTNKPDYSGPAGTHVHGESSAGFDQKTYSLELWDEGGNDQAAGLLGMPAESDWILYGPWSEKTLMRNKLIYDWMLTLRGEDGTSVRSRFVELFFNQSKTANGQIGYSTYRGIYVLLEKIKRGKDRVPLESLNEKTVDPDLITGGYIIRKDKPDALKNSWVSPHGVDLQSFDPDRFNAPQLAYIKGYITTFESALYGTNFRDNAKGYRAYIDPDTFIDAQWMLEISKQVDGYVFSTYWHKDRFGRLRAGPIWDFNIALGNADYGTGDTPTGWLYGNANGVGQIWYPRLHADPEYRLAHWDRYWEMRRGFLSTEAVMAKIQEHMALLLDGSTTLVSNRAPATLQSPVARHFRRWPRLGTRDWPNPPAETSIRTWQAEVGYMTNWLNTRLQWLDSQSMSSGSIALVPPVLSHPGGVISEPLQVELSAYSRVTSGTSFPTGDIYYTLDNSDPRLPGGSVNPEAFKYSSPVQMKSSATLKARLFTAQKLWSPLASATYFLNALPASASNLTISELMFSPALPTAAETNASLLNPQGFEFIELRNTSYQPVDLTGVKLTRGVDFDFQFAPTSSRLLQPGESIVLVSDARAFSLRYPQVPRSKIAGPFRGHLDNSGETIRLEAADGSTIQEFRFDSQNPWPSISPGHSLVLLNPISRPDLAASTNWVLSARLGGTPAESGTGSLSFSGDPRADTDSDGLSDIFEFATGSDPENPQSKFPLLLTLSPSSSAGSMNLNFHRNPFATGVRVKLETSQDLKSWSTDLNAWVKQASVTNLDGTVSETYRAPLPTAPLSSASFFRLRVE